MVVVKRYTKLADFFPCSSSITSKETADLFVQEIFARHGLPKEIISKCGPQFISNFWSQFLKGLSIKPCQSSGYHPQSDEQTELVNQILEQYLCCFVPARQDTWVDHLRFAQFAYNNATQASIGMSPFMKNFGYHPQTLMGTPTKVVLAADDLVNAICNIRSTLDVNLKKAINAYKSAADNKRKEHTHLSPGDLVMVEAGNFKLPLASRKMGPRRIGPFKMLRQINEVAYKVELPPKSRVHPVFHVSQLRKFLGEAPAPLDPVLSANPGEAEFEVEAILDTRLSCKKRQFLIKWKGYPIKDASWEPELNLNGCPELLADFHSRHPNLAGGDVMASNGLLH